MPSNMHCRRIDSAWVGAIEHSSTVRRAHLPDLRAKKSRSTVSCPILACSFSISDQGSQFTSALSPGALAGAGIKISMDGRGRWMDNVFIERLWRSLKQ